MKGDDYNYCEFRWDRFKREGLHFHNGAPEPGELARDFDLPTVPNGRFRLRDRRGQNPILLEFGSITCPLATGARSGLLRLYNDFERDVEFVSVYVREALPAGEYPHHTSDDQKMMHARDWTARHAIPWAVAVDGLDGHTHRSYGGLQNCAYLIGTSGRVAFRALCAGDEGLLRGKLRELLRLELAREPLVNLGQVENILIPFLHSAGEFYRMRNKRAA